MVKLPTLLVAVAVVLVYSAQLSLLTRRQVVPSAVAGTVKVRDGLT